MRVSSTYPISNNNLVLIVPTAMISNGTEISMNGHTNKRNAETQMRDFEIGKKGET